VHDAIQLQSAVVSFCRILPLQVHRQAQVVDHPHAATHVHHSLLLALSPIRPFASTRSGLRSLTADLPGLHHNVPGHCRWQLGRRNAASLQRDLWQYEPEHWPANRHVYLHKCVHLAELCWVLWQVDLRNECWSNWPRAESRELHSHLVFNPDLCDRLHRLFGAWGWPWASKSTVKESN